MKPASKGREIRKYLDLQRELDIIAHMRTEKKYSLEKATGKNLLAASDYTSDLAARLLMRRYC